MFASPLAKKFQTFRLGIQASYASTAPSSSNLQNATCFNVLKYLPLSVELGLKTRVSRYATEAATFAQPLLNEMTLALVKTLNEGAVGTRARAKKYSMLSSKPVKLPSGETRPEALALKRPLGTAAPP